jgi:hypothetical protein
MLTIVSLLKSMTAIVYNLLVVILLQSAYIFGVFPATYFSYLSVACGVLGATTGLFVKFSILYKRIDEGDPLARPMRTAGWISTGLQPFAAGMSSFMFCAGFRGLTEGGQKVWGAVGYSQGYEIAIGMTTGLLAIYLLSPEFLKWVANSIMGQFIGRIIGKKDA